MITFDEFKKVELRIGEILKIDKNKIEVKCGDKIYNFKGKLEAKKGEKLVIIIDDGKIIIPCVDNSPIAPEREIKEGMRIS